MGHAITEGVTTNLSQRLEAQVVSLRSLDLVASRKPSVSIHDECNVLRNWSLAHRAYNQLAHLVHAPFNWRR